MIVIIIILIILIILLLIIIIIVVIIHKRPAASQLPAQRHAGNTPTTTAFHRQPKGALNRAEPASEKPFEPLSNLCKLVSAAEKKAPSGLQSAFLAAGLRASSCWVSFVLHPKALRPRTPKISPAKPEKTVWVPHSIRTPTYSDITLNPKP